MKRRIGRVREHGQRMNTRMRRNTPSIYLAMLFRCSLSSVSRVPSALYASVLKMREMAYGVLSFVLLLYEPLKSHATQHGLVFSLAVMKLCTS